MKLISLQKLKLVSYCRVPQLFATFRECTIKETFQRLQCAGPCHCSLTCYISFTLRRGNPRDKVILASSWSSEVRVSLSNLLKKGIIWLW